MEACQGGFLKSKSVKCVCSVRRLPVYWKAKTKKCIYNMKAIQCHEADINCDHNCKILLTISIITYQQLTNISFGSRHQQKVTVSEDGVGTPTHAKWLAFAERPDGRTSHLLLTAVVK